MLKIYSVYDAPAMAYLRPFFLRTNGEALRSFADEVTNSDSIMAKHPGDYKLVELGSYDESTGLITSLEAPSPLASGLDFLQAQS